MSGFIELLKDWDPNALGAAANLGMFLIALLVAGLSIIPIRQARRVREEQAQPYVVAFMELSLAGNQIVDLVVKNFGTTMARDVLLRSNPTIKRGTGNGTDTEDVWIFETLPTLAPGQEWRSFWDTAFNRNQANLPDRHEVTITFKDSRLKEMPSTVAVLDWAMYGQTYINVYGAHDSAVALRKISKAVESWREGSNGGLKVTVRDGDAKDERRRDEFERWRAAQGAPQQVPQQQSSNGNGASEPEPASDTGTGSG